MQRPSGPSARPPNLSRVRTVRRYKVQANEDLCPTYMEDVMAGRWQWTDLSPRSRRLIVAAATAEAGLKVAALIDIKRRPASQIRGPKWLWATVVVLVNSFGGAPVSYFLFGRRR